MKGNVWRAFLGSFVLFLLSCVSCVQERREADELAFDGLACGGGFPSDGAIIGGLLFIASISVAAGGAVGWWRAEVVGEPDVGALVLGIGGTAAANVEAIEETQDGAREEGAALPEASLTPEDAHPFEHFDEQGRSPLERVLAQY